MSETELNKELDDATIKAIAKKGRESLFFLTRAILAFDKLTKDIHRPICRDLQNYIENTRIEVIVPRDWYKSTICSIAYPIWRVINDPNVRILIVQNSYNNAIKKLGSIKQIFENSELFRACYPEILPTARSVWTKECLTVNRTLNAPEGSIEAAGTGTAVTSRHYDVIIEDDTVAPELDALTGVMMQPTQAEIEKAIGWHRLAHPLLMEPAESQIIVVGTRWAQRDLLSWIMENSPEYKLITRAVRENENGEPDPKGKVVWPRRFNSEILKQLETNVGVHMYSALYMNLPTSAMNQVFKREWIHYFTSVPKGCIYCTSVDPACPDTDQSSDPDYTVVLTTAINPTNGHIYIVHYTRERMNPGEQVNAIFDHYRAFKPMKVIIEGINYERTLKYYVEQRMKPLKEYFVVETIKGWKASKGDRIRGLQPFFGAAKIFMKTTMKELEQELLAFPKGAHDDIIDDLSSQLGFWHTVNREHEYAEKRIGRLNAHSGLNILKELEDRAHVSHAYPNDIGNIGDCLQVHREIEELEVGTYEYV